MGHSISRVVKIYMKSVEMDFFPGRYTQRWFLPCEQAPAERAEGRTGRGCGVSFPSFLFYPFFFRLLFTPSSPSEPAHMRASGFRHGRSGDDEFYDRFMAVSREQRTEQRAISTDVWDQLYINDQRAKVSCKSEGWNNSHGDTYGGFIIAWNKYMHTKSGSVEFNFGFLDLNEWCKNSHCKHYVLPGWWSSKLDEVFLHWSLSTTNLRDAPSLDTTVLRPLCISCKCFQQQYNCQIW